LNVSFLTELVGYLGAALQVGLLYLLVRGPLSRYFPLFLYVASYLGLTVVEGWYLSREGTSGMGYFGIYWGGELLLDVLMLMLVISLTMRALEGSPILGPVKKFLLVVMGVAVVLPFILFGKPGATTDWYRGTAQLLNFGAAIMNLGLWTALLTSRKRDRQLLAVSAGLGIALTSAAMTFGIGRFTQPNTFGREVAEYAHRFLQIGSFLIWCWAFRHVRKPAPAEPATVSEG
jgi:hypothetical protein